MALSIIQKLLLLSFSWLGEDTVNYESQVRHVFQERCFACHGALKQEGGLRLDTAAAAIKGGDSGSAVIPGKSSESRLVVRISASDLSERMPPEGEPLKPGQISAIRQWIEQGAVAPENEVSESDPRDHWSFKAPRRPELPEIKHAAWVLNPIDAFIAKTHEDKRLTPQLPADRRTWLRRVSLDLIGLVPTIEEQNAFLSDESPAAYENVVNRLLASPHYGERWGRHWMDIWRYSDWWGLGAEVRNSQKHIWHWRDWIIESLNNDVSYDQMLREMLAADELYPNDPAKLRASGFLARQYFKFNRTSWLDETVEHTSKAMLGLTFNCCKCHDHKYDPISHVEYYQLRAIFEPYQVRTDAVPGELDFEKDGIPRAFDCNADAITYLHVRGDDRNPDKVRQISPTVPAFLQFGEFAIQPITLPTEAHQPGLKPHVIAAHLSATESEIKKARTAVALAEKKLDEAEMAEKTKLSGLAAAEKSSTPEILIAEDFSTEKAEIWEATGGLWLFQDHRLLQSKTGAEQSRLRLRQVPPADFQATLKYVPRGGDVWKSVGIRFDVTEDEDDVLVYLSSYEAGPKLQVAYKNKGMQTYPGDGAQPRAVNLNESHELTILVRGTLINVVVDGKASLAYRLPVSRRPGSLELITFDAQAAFEEFKLKTLPLSVPMKAAANDQPEDRQLPIDQARLAVQLAEKSLQKCELEPASIHARAAAERAQLQTPGIPQLSELIRAAVLAEKSVALASAEEELLRAEIALMQTMDDKREDAESGLAKAEDVVEKARTALGTPSEQFTPISGSLKTLENNLEKEDSRRKPFPKTSTGRRSALAHWMTDPRHPLPSRVAVNHLWARHFGKGLVTSVFDFGRKGAPPTHPELLDWLAIEFMENDWSMKHIHRLIVLSNTYRMSSSSINASETNVKTDGDNRYYWRRNAIRMESQVVRDNLLSIAGELDLAMGGPSIPVNDEKSRRRSLYFVHSHNEHQKFLSMFDDANVLECYRRAESIVPQQALAMENSPLAGEMAYKIASQLFEAIVTEEATDEAFVRKAFLTVLSVEPTPHETAAAIDALRQLTAASVASGREQPQQQARANLVHALLNHNDFVTVR